MSSARAGMATVHRAKDLEHNRSVALKVLEHPAERSPLGVATSSTMSYDRNNVRKVLPAELASFVGSQP